jgi:hypothetical protein
LEEYAREIDAACNTAGAFGGLYYMSNFFRDAAGWEDLTYPLVRKKVGCEGMRGEVKVRGRE